MMDPIPDEVKRHWRVVAAVETASDIGAACIATAYLGERLTTAIKACFVAEADNNKIIHKALFGKGRPLGSFYTKTELAYALGLLGPKARKDLDLIREIRNELAHLVDTLTFDTPCIKSRCNELWIPKNILWFGKDAPPQAPRDQFLAAVYIIFNLLHTECVTVQRTASGPHCMP